MRMIHQEVQTCEVYSRLAVRCSKKEQLVALQKNVYHVSPFFILNYVYHMSVACWREMGGCATLKYFTCV